MLDPNRVLLSAALGLWTAAPLIAFFAQLSAGVGLPVVLTPAAGLGPLIVVVPAVVTRHSHSAIGPFDLLRAAIAGAALVV
ncbi:hypothetical protein [Pseudonocardia alni]|uniref:hypothetical protein n=1 Tax=Pseudonocardia alni TaxID=33907 RepID=UPI001ABEF52B|nr:hypothetical protein [Pseudonocardia alni]